ncbi:hypothetical protein MTsPCn9_28400 [Croceitalea sp. MTPC9]|uniref:hypothetical protein n=1 Tax=unclassified Croceitalea TaxID=2632280 RepID=UPI002B3936CF|nr:hypothetical protein MTsPCn6_29890 [Croceitalea sp. MTPC6]GMN17900.1 hypothetical protein MTsPCn9_28400 [Croceitalea sp. MTPC9]
MKTILKNSVAAAILLSSTLSMANAPENSFGKKTNAKNEVEKNILSIDLDPTFKKKGDKVLVNLLNLSKGKVILKVYDSEGRIVYKESLEGEIVIEKAFNFSNAYEDEYTVVVVDKLGTYKEKIEVK